MLSLEALAPCLVMRLFPLMTCHTIACSYGMLAFRVGASPSPTPDTCKLVLEHAKIQGWMIG